MRRVATRLFLTIFFFSFSVRGEYFLIETDDTNETEVKIRWVSARSTPQPQVFPKSQPQVFPKIHVINVVIAQASLPHWNILCRPEVGEDYASSSSSSSSSSPFVCLNPENFDGREQDLLELKLLLKRNPRKNLNLAKKFFSQNPGHPSNLLDYDYQVKRLKYQT